MGIGDGLDGGYGGAEADLQEVRGSGTASRPSCSQSAHDQNVLARCAQCMTVWLLPMENEVVDRTSGKNFVRRPQSGRESREQV